MSVLDFIIACLTVAAVLVFIAVSAMFLIWWERKVSAHMQTRFGPMRTGWHGWLQSIADAIKLLMKENIVPAGVDKLAFNLAPYVVVTAAIAAFVVLPFGKGLIPKDLNMGIFYILAITSIGVLGIFMAGWGSNNKFSLLGGMRSVAQILSYEVPIVLSVITVVMCAGSLSMVRIVEAQHGAWFILKPNLASAFLIYIIAATAETNRTPFDIPEAESELVAGFHTEYSGMKFAMFFVAEYTNLFLVSGIAATLFLGGYNGPMLPNVPEVVSGAAWFLIKSYAVVFLLMWFRWTFPRLRVDQMMAFAWKLMVPVSFANLLVTGWLLL